MAEPLQDEQRQSSQFAFNGAWLPDQPSGLIGFENYSTLRNLRYKDAAFEGVLGYSKINTTALAYPLLRNGHQFQTDRDTASYVLLHAENASGDARIYQNQTDIPDQGQFQGTVLHTPATGAQMSRFSAAPGGNVSMCNGVESYIWAGDKMRVAGFYTCDDASNTNPRDYTDAVNNEQTSTGNLAALSSTQEHFLIFSTRPAKGFDITVQTANTSAATLTVNYWSGAAWVAVSNLSDGTSDGTHSMGQSGSITFDSTVSVAKPYHFQGIYLYAYQCILSACSNGTQISHVAIDAPWQAMVDVWDGVYRECVTFQASRSSKYEDYTLEVNEESSIQYPICATLGGIASSDHVIVMFQERMSAIRMSLMAGLTNDTAATATVSYWDGDSWETVTGLSDGTSSGGDSMKQTGTMSWNPVAEGSEFPQTLFGVTGYAYKISWSATLDDGTDHDGTSVDFCSGIPAQTTIKPFKFPAIYKNMVLLCGYVQGKEGHRVDFSMPNAPDVFNGSLSSMDGLQSLYFGGTEELMAGVQLYNRFGSNVYSTFVALKKSETHLLNGDSPEDFKIFPISYNVGCPAPLTLATAELGFEMAEEVVRNVAIWLSYSGPVMFDGAVLRPLRGVEKYFDPSEDDCLNTSAIANARGWYDQTYREYNLLIPSGAGQTTCNLWLVYDLVRRKWFEKHTGAAETPQCGFQVVDEDGVKYTYGGIDAGYMMRLENGTSWDGEPIAQKAVTGDAVPTGSIWDETTIRRIKVLAKRINEDHTLQVTHIADSDDEGLGVALKDQDNAGFGDNVVAGWKSPFVMTLSLSETTAKDFVKTSSECNLTATHHRMEFEVETTSTERAWQPIAWGFQYFTERTDR